jgi:hypothetical protein
MMTLPVRGLRRKGFELVLKRDSTEAIGGPLPKAALFQCDIRVGTATVSRMLRVTPPQNEVFASDADVPSRIVSQAAEAAADLVVESLIFALDQRQAEMIEASYRGRKAREVAMSSSPGGDVRHQISTT